MLIPHNGLRSFLTPRAMPCVLLGNSTEKRGHMSISKLGVGKVLGIELMGCGVGITALLADELIVQLDDENDNP